MYPNQSRSLQCYFWQTNHWKRNRVLQRRTNLVLQRTSKLTRQHRFSSCVTNLAIILTRASDEEDVDTYHNKYMPSSHPNSPQILPPAPS